MKIPSPSLFHAILLNCLLCPAALAQDYSVYFQQGSFVRINGKAMPWIYTDGKDTEIRSDQPDTNFDGGTAGADGPNGPESLARLAEGAADGTSAYLIRFDEVFTGKYLPLKPGYRLTSAFLLLDFDQLGADLDQLVNRVPWDDSSTTWNSFGSPDDGVNSASDAEPIRPVSLYSDQLVIDVTEEVGAWMSGAQPNYGWTFLSSGIEETHLRTHHFRDLAEANEGKPLYLPAGYWGIRDRNGVYQVTRPQLQNTGAFGSPALVLHFRPGSDPSFPPPGGGGGGGGGENEGESGPPPGGGSGGPPPPPGGPSGGPQRDGSPVITKNSGGGVTVRAYSWPDLRREFECGPDLENFPDQQEAEERQPGCYEINDQAQQDRKFWRIVHSGEACQRAGGGSSPAREDCPANMLGELFDHVERAGREYLAAVEEVEQNALIEKLRAVQFVYEIASRYLSSVYGTPFDSTLRGLISGKAELKPVLGPDEENNEVRLNNEITIASSTEACQVLEDALKYLRFIIWWQSTSDKSLSDEDKTELRAALRQIDQRLMEINNIKQAIQNNPNDLAPLLTFQQNLCDDFQRFRGQANHPVTKVLVKVLVWAAQEGATGLIDRALSSYLGKGFTKGSFKRGVGLVEAIMNLIDAGRARAADGRREEALCLFNQALCKLVEEADALEKFQLRAAEGPLSFTLLHAGGRLREELVSVTATARLVCWVPDGSGQEGKGEWQSQNLQIAKDTGGTPQYSTNPVTFTNSQGDDQTNSFNNDLLIQFPPAPQGRKCYIVLEAVWQYKTKTERLNFFLGSVQASDSLSD